MRNFPVETENENGSPEISFRNIVKVMQHEGSPVGIAHIVLPNGDQISQVFFYKGYYIQVLGLAVGYEDGMDEQRLARVSMMQQTLCMIPSWTAVHDEQYIMNLGLDMKESKDIVRYILRLTDQKILGFMDNSPGAVSINNYIDIEEARGHTFR